MIDQLFGSKTRVKLLHLFYSNPNRSFYVREITRKINEQINSVRRELSNLLSIGIIKSDSNNNKLYYEVNQKFKHYDAMRSIFGGDKVTVSAKAAQTGTDLSQRFRETGAIKGVYLTGTFTREDSIKVDIVVVGDVNRTKLNKLIAQIENEEGRELNFAVFSEEDFAYRRDLNDRFIVQFMDAKKTPVIDELGISEKK